MTPPFGVSDAYFSDPRSEKALSDEQPETSTGVPAARSLRSRRWTAAGERRRWQRYAARRAARDGRTDNRSSTSTFRAYWVNRTGAPVERLGVRPDAVVKDLTELAVLLD